MFSNGLDSLKAAQAQLQFIHSQLREGIELRQKIRKKSGNSVRI
jgi:hypothetical protein